MIRMLTVTLLFAVTGCPGGGGNKPTDTPDAATQPMPDAPKQPPDAPKKGYGQACSNGGQCTSGLCVGETGSQSICSIPCNIEVANDCRSVDAFCVPIGGGDNACFGMIETLNDPDDAILSVGDTTTRAVTPLTDADMFQVRLDQIGKIRFTVTPSASIDVKLEAYGMVGDALGSSNDAGPSLPESLGTDVQQLGTHMFLVVRNVGTSTGNYTFSVTKVPAFTSEPSPNTRRQLESAP